MTPYVQQVAEQAIANAESVIPELSKHIIARNVVTPYTFERSFLMPEGANYGFDLRTPKPLLQKSPIKGLYLASASTRMGGVEAVIRAGIWARNDIIGWQELAKNFISEWYKEVTQKTADQKASRFLVQDKTGNPVVFAWEKIAASDPTFTPKVASLTDIFIAAHTRPSVELLKQHPEAVTRIKVMRPFEPLFKQGIEKVDWAIVEEHMKIGMKQFWQNDHNSYNQQAICWFVIAHDQKKETPLGFVEFLLTPADPYGSIQVKTLMIYPEAQHRGLGKLLISSIFKLIPFVQRIFLTTLCTNNQAQRAYNSYGFKEYTDSSKPINPEGFDQYDIHFEYLTDQSATLQKMSAQLKEIRK